MKKILLITLFMIKVVLPNNLFAQQDSTHIGFILANLYSERSHKDMAFFKEKANDLGGKVTFIDCFDRQEEQLKAVQTLIDLNVDCIVYVPISSEDSVVVNNAKEANIPVIAYDRLVYGSKLDLYVTFDSEQVGEEMASQVLNKLPSGNILFVGGPVTDFNSSRVRKGVFTVLKSQKDNYTIKNIHVNDWNELNAFMTVQQYLGESKFKPDAIICSSDVLAIGVLYLLEEKGWLGKVLITGQDGDLKICQQIMKDNVLMTVYKSNKLLAYSAAKAAITLGTGEELNGTLKGNYFMNVPTIKKATTVLTKDNMEQMMSLLHLYSKEELHVTDL